MHTFHTKRRIGSNRHENGLVRRGARLTLFVDFRLESVVDRSTSLEALPGQPARLAGRALERWMAAEPDGA
jgi:hypothetical protein